MTQQFAPPQGSFPQAFAPPQQQVSQQQGWNQPQQAYGQPQGYPQQYQQPYPQPGYGAPQGYPQQYQQAPAAEPAPSGSLSDFWAQPSTGGGQSLAFKQQGTAYLCEVTRDVVDSDVQAQTEINNPQKLATYRDGRQKWVMKVPSKILQSNVDVSGYSDGVAQWFCQGAARDELVRAMTAVGLDPQVPPKGGDQFMITYTGDRSAGPGMNPAKQYSIEYRRPPEVAARIASQGNGHAAAPAQPEQAPQQATSFPQQQVPAQAGPPSAPNGFPAQGGPQPLAPTAAQQTAVMAQGVREAFAEQQGQPAPQPPAGFNAMIGAPPQAAPQQQAPAPMAGFGQQAPAQGPPAPPQQAAPQGQVDVNGLDADQQALFQKLLAQQQGQQG